MPEFSSRDVLLYVNAINRTMTRKGITKEIGDDFWQSDIAPILYPTWDSDRDKLESLIRYSDGKTIINKVKFQRNQKTKEYKWVSYELKLGDFLPAELDNLYTTLDEKFTEYRGLVDITLEEKLSGTFAKDNIVSWSKLLMVRKFLLQESDWTQLADAPIAEEDKPLWLAYRQKLRDMTEEQKNVPASTVRFPITPVKYRQAIDEGRTSAEYLTEYTEHFYNASQSMLNKFANKMVAYLTVALNSGAISDVPTLTAYREETALDEILKVIEAGGFE